MRQGHITNKQCLVRNSINSSYLGIFLRSGNEQNFNKSLAEGENRESKHWYGTTEKIILTGNTLALQIHREK